MQVYKPPMQNDNSQGKIRNSSYRQALGVPSISSPENSKNF
jgi:hypothetical protein